MSPLSDFKSVQSSPFAPGVATSAVFQASYTGGAPGPVTFQWTLDSTGGGNANFTNPLNASSQRILVAVPTDHITRHATAHCVVTDSRGDASPTPLIDFGYLGT